MKDIKMKKRGRRKVINVDKVSKGQYQENAGHQSGRLATIAFGICSDTSDSCVKITVESFDRISTCIRVFVLIGEL